MSSWVTEWVRSCIKQLNHGQAGVSYVLTVKSHYWKSRMRSLFGFFPSLHMQPGDREDSHLNNGRFKCWGFTNERESRTGHKPRQERQEVNLGMMAVRPYWHPRSDIPGLIASKLRNHSALPLTSLLLLSQAGELRPTEPNQEQSGWVSAILYAKIQRAKELLAIRCSNVHLQSQLSEAEQVQGQPQLHSSS